MKSLFESSFPNYWSTIGGREPIWQTKYYGLNIWSRAKVEEKQKLEYMHLNPVRADLVKTAMEWKYSSARWYLQQRGVGIAIRWPPGLDLDDDFDGD